MDARKERILTLWAGGKSATEIAKELGVTRNVVMGIIHRNRTAGAERRKTGPKPEKQAKPEKRANPGGIATKAAAAREKARNPAEQSFNASSLALEARRVARLGDLPADGLVAFVLQTSGQCKFPMWANGPVPPIDQAMVCGRPIEGDGAPYCGAHARVCCTAPIGPRNAGFAIR